jgi:hypothetical protein
MKEIFKNLEVNKSMLLLSGIITLKKRDDFILFTVLF